MVNYGNGIIYKLCCNDLNITDIYIGSTTNFNRRKQKHKECVIYTTSKKNVYKVYQYIMNNGNWENWSMVMIEEYKCNTKRELETRERYWYELLNAQLNMRMPVRSKKEYAETHKEDKKIYDKERRTIKDKEIKEKKKIAYDKNKVRVKCEICDIEISRNSLNDHNKTITHKNNIILLK